MRGGSGCVVSRALEVSRCSVFGRGALNTLLKPAGDAAQAGPASAGGKCDQSTPRRANLQTRSTSKHQEDCPQPTNIGANLAHAGGEALTLSGTRRTASRQTPVQTILTGCGPGGPLADARTGFPATLEFSFSPAVTIAAGLSPRPATGAITSAWEDRRFRNYAKKSQKRLS